MWLPNERRNGDKRRPWRLRRAMRRGRGQAHPPRLLRAPPRAGVEGRPFAGGSKPGGTQRLRRLLGPGSESSGTGASPPGTRWPPQGKRGRLQGGWKEPEQSAGCRVGRRGRAVGGASAGRRGRGAFWGSAPEPRSRAAPRDHWGRQPWGGLRPSPSRSPGHTQHPPSAAQLCLQPPL